MVSQFGSLGYTIMGKTADLTVVQKTIIDTLHKEGKPQTFIPKEAGCSQSAVSKHVNRKLSGREKCVRKRCTTNRENRSLMRIDSRIWANFTRNGLRLGSRHQEPPHTDLSRNLATIVFRGVLPGLRRRRTGLLPSGPKVLFSDESKFCISFGNQGPRVWRKGGEAHSPSCLKSSVKFTQSVMIQVSKTPVERVNSFKFGVHITKDLTWSAHTDAVLKKAHQRLFFLKRLRKFGTSPSNPQILLHLHCGEHPDRLHHRLVWKQHRWQPQSSAKGRANCPPHCWRWTSLPPGHLHQAVYKESQEDHQGLHAISSAGVGPLYFLKTNVTAPVYQEILEHFMLPSADHLFNDADFIFQQDLAPVHTAKSTKSWLNDHGVGVLDWPANSPDLNPIQNLWGIFKRKMRNKRPKKCRLIEAVIKTKGAPTKNWVHIQ